MAQNTQIDQDALAAEWGMALEAESGGAPPPVAARAPVTPADASSEKMERATSAVVSSKVAFRSGAKVELMDAPPGVVFREEQSMLDWTPTPFSKIPEAKVLFLLTHPDGSEETLIHTIQRN